MHAYSLPHAYLVPQSIAATMYRCCRRRPPASPQAHPANNDAKETVTGSILTWPGCSHGYDNDKQ